MKDIKYTALLLAALVLSSCGGEQQNNPVGEEIVGSTGAEYAVTAVYDENAEPVAISAQTTHSADEYIEMLSQSDINVTFEEAETTEILDYETILCGLLSRQSVGYYSKIDGMIAIEAEYGFTETVTDREILLHFYNYTDKNISIKSAHINMLNDPDEGFDVEFDETSDYTLNTDGFDVGAYRITVMLSTGNKMQLCFYVKPERTYACKTINVENSRYSVAGLVLYGIDIPFVAVFAAGVTREFKALIARVDLLFRSLVRGSIDGFAVVVMLLRHTCGGGCIVCNLIP